MLGFLGMVGSTSGESTDREQFIELYSQIEQKCSSAATQGPSAASTSFTFEFNVYDEIKVERDKLVAENSEGGTMERELTGCDYSFSGMPASADDSRDWTFKISQESTGYPPTVLVEASS